MLNINAKAFVPPGNDTRHAPHAIESGFYRYRIDTPVQKVVASLKKTTSQSNLFSLLSSKHLFSVRGGFDEETLQYFLSESFISATNFLTSGADNKTGSGFLLSRSLLALHADLNLINLFNDAHGYLIRLDIPVECGFETSVMVNTMWDYFFNYFRKDKRFMAFGYCRSLVGSNQNQSGGTYRHHFFVASSSFVETDEFDKSLVNTQGMGFLRVVPISSIIPFVCSSQMTLSIVATIGEEAREKLLENAAVCFYFEVEYFGTDYARTYENIKLFEEYYLGILRGGCKWENFCVMHLHIKLFTSGSKNTVPIWDFLRHIGRLCDDTSAGVLGVSFSSVDELPDSKQLFALNSQAPFFLNASLDEMLEKGHFLDTANIVCGGIPQAICRSLRSSTLEAATKALKIYQDKSLSRMLTENLLTRMLFATAADHFANRCYFARRKSLGTEILLGTDHDGKVFGIDLSTFSIFGLTNSFGGVIGPLRDCIFKGTLSSSYRAFCEYRIIIEDVFIFQGREMFNSAFIDRWHALENTDLNEEDSWPHVTFRHVVFLKAGYLPLERTENFIHSISNDHTTRGIVFIANDLKKSSEMDALSYLWKPPSSLTVFFYALKVEAVSESNGQIKRIFLAVRGSETDNSFVDYEGEYVDFLVEAYNDVKVGSVVDCILRRADDGAHWWDVLRVFKPGIHAVSTREEVRTLVHSPGITQQEMLWLLNAPKYRCGRCRKVNDAGRINPKHNAYWCKNCWRETGHGDCIYCSRTYVLGMCDGTSNFFYCENCWNIFSSTNTQAEIGYHVPPPQNATFTEQVRTRCISLLIDLVNPKCPTGDVIDLCCGDSVVRKWMRNKTMRYVGIDLKRSVVDATMETIAHSTELPLHGRYDVVCADAFSEDFWAKNITKIHPRQFHTITCFSGLHHAFQDEEKARHFMGSVANALVPGGLFLGIFIDASVLYAKGKKYESSIFRVSWKEDAVPRIGNRFTISIENGPLREIVAIPIDFLIAVASEYSLQVIPEACQTIRELIEKDPSWTRVPTIDEKEYLCTLRSFAFKKKSSEQLPSKNLK